MAVRIGTEFLYIDYTLATEEVTITFADLTASQEESGQIVSSFTEIPRVVILAVRGNTYVEITSITTTTVTFRLGDIGQGPPINIDWKLVSRDFDISVSDDNLLRIVNQVRRLVNDQIISGTSLKRTNIEVIEYLKDSNDEVRQDYEDFTSFTISGTTIDPAPDNVDRRLLALKSAELITLEDWRESAGDAILIQTGSIKLDTSKGTNPLRDITKYIQDEYINLIDNLKMNGKSSTTSTLGYRIDNYKSRTTDTRASDSLI